MKMGIGQSLNPRSELPCRMVKGLLCWPVTRHFEDHGSRGRWSLLSCLPHFSHLSRKRVSRSLLGAGNYPSGPLGPILSGCTLTSALNPFNKAGLIPTTGDGLCASVTVQTHSRTRRQGPQVHTFEIYTSKWNRNLGNNQGMCMQSYRSAKDRNWKALVIQSTRKGCDSSWKKIAI